MKHYKIVALVLFASFAHCSKTPKELIDLGQESLKEAKAKEALDYYKEAYEKSFEDDFFYFDRDENYDDLTVSSNGNVLAALQKNEFKKHSTIYVYNISKEETWSKTLPSVVRSFSLSPSGEYMTVVYETESGKCEASVWSTVEKEQYPFTAYTGCNHIPAVSSSGLLLFLLDGKIASYNIRSASLNKEYISGVPEPPVAGMPAWAWFQFSPGGAPFLTYGSAGVYKLYSLREKKLDLITKEGATGRLYFYNSRSEVGIITGGANNHRVVFYSFLDGSVVSRLPVKSWKDAAFLDSGRYYFIEENSLYLYENGSIQDLPFFATQVFPVDSGDLVIFEKPGKIYRYSGKPVLEMTSLAFHLIGDLKE